jgi:hypothetical protein
VYYARVESKVSLRLEVYHPRGGETTGAVDGTRAAVVLSGISSIPGI